MTSYSLDTDTITKLLKKHPGNQRVLDRFRKEIRRNSSLHAIEYGAAIVTGNIEHFQDIGARVEDWNQ